MSSDARRSSAKNATLTNTITHTAHVAQRNMSHHSSSCFMFKLTQTRDKDAHGSLERVEAAASNRQDKFLSQFLKIFIQVPFTQSSHIRLVVVAVVHLMHV